MIDTLHLVPPDFGPRSNPVLYGVAAALAERFPPIAAAPRAGEDESEDLAAAAAAETTARAAAAG